MGMLRKPVQKFLYKQPNEVVVAKLNEEYPIDIRNLQFIVNSIHRKYPKLPKSKINAIIVASFESMRELLIQGYTLAMYEIYNEMKLYVQKQTNKNRDLAFTFKATPSLHLRKGKIDD
jgi:hypothetical protein